MKQLGVWEKSKTVERLLFPSEAHWDYERPSKAASTLSLCRRTPKNAD